MEDFNLKELREKLRKCLDSSTDFLSDNPMPRPKLGENWLREKNKRTTEWTAKFNKCLQEITKDMTDSQVDQFRKYVNDLIDEYKMRVNGLTD
jgi:hypothetical protein